MDWWCTIGMFVWEGIRPEGVRKEQELGLVESGREGLPKVEYERVWAGMLIFLNCISLYLISALVLSTSLILSDCFTPVLISFDPILLSCSFICFSTVFILLSVFFSVWLIRFWWIDELVLCCFLICFTIYLSFKSRSADAASRFWVGIRR